MKVTRYPDIEPARRGYIDQVDQLTNELRGRYFTTGPGQAMSYERKEAQARAYKEGESGPFNWLEKQAERTGETLTDIAQAIIDQATAWEDTAAVLEAERIATKQSIRAASTVREIYKITQQFKATLGEIEDRLDNL